MKWEYKLMRLFGVVSPKGTETVRILRELGEAGWEIVSVWTQEQKGALAGLETLMLCKRPLDTGGSSNAD